MIRSGLDEIEISLDGDSGAQSDEVRRRSSFERIAANIFALADANRDARAPLTISVATTQFKKTGREGKAVEPDWLSSSFAAYPEIRIKPT